ncbi:MAG: hypothetical protein CMJ90_15115, partial [Planctomycetes bacterium]|nr:hypothetical protein [Planctomycetota bacterium]
FAATTTALAFAATTTASTAFAALTFAATTTASTALAALTFAATTTASTALAFAATAICQHLADLGPIQLAVAVLVVLLQHLRRDAAGAALTTLGLSDTGNDDQRRQRADTNTSHQGTPLLFVSEGRGPTASPLNCYPALAAFSGGFFRRDEGHNGGT